MEKKITDVGLFMVGLVYAPHLPALHIHST